MAIPEITFILLIALAGFVFKVASSVRNQLDRLERRITQLNRLELRRSATFMKLENDLETSLNVLALISQNDPKVYEEAERTILERHDRLREQIEFGPGQSETLRGIEFPEESDDAWFWSDRSFRHIVPLAYDTSTNDES